MAIGILQSFGQKEVLQFCSFAVKKKFCSSAVLQLCSYIAVSAHYQIFKSSKFQ